MITGDQAKELAAKNKVTAEQVEESIRRHAQVGRHDTTFPVDQWMPEVEPLLVDAGFVVRRGGIDDQVVIVEWK